MHTHQKRAKYCLEKRGQQQLLFTCEMCSKTFTEKRYLQTHESKCDAIKSTVLSLRKELQESKEENIKLKAIIAERDSQVMLLREQVKDLSSRLENVAIKSSLKPTYNNTNNLKLERLTDQHLK